LETGPRKEDVRGMQLEFFKKSEHEPTKFYLRDEDNPKCETPLFQNVENGPWEFASSARKVVAGLNLKPKWGYEP
jgi:hypothetical protein